jgi:hypothetical protein
MASVLKVDKLKSRDGVSKLTLNNMQSGFILGSAIFRNGTRSAVSGAAEATLFGGSFTKQRSDTVLIATNTVFGAGYYSGNCGVGMKLDNTWHFGTGYQYDGAWSATAQVTVINGQGYWSGIAAGSHTLYWGWKCADGGAGNRPFNYFNPNSNDDSRLQQVVSSMIVYEVYP